MVHTADPPSSGCVESDGWKSVITPNELYACLPSNCSQGYHTCYSADEVEMLGLTAEKCINVAENDDFYATADMGKASSKCSIFANYETLAKWGCSSPNSSAIHNQCGVLNSAIKLELIESTAENNQSIYSNISLNTNIYSNASSNMEFKPVYNQTNLGAFCCTDIPGIGCAHKGIEREVITDAIYACSSTYSFFSGYEHILGDVIFTEIASCNDGYHICTDANEAERLGLTNFVCSNIEQNGIFFGTLEGRISDECGTDVIYGCSSNTNPSDLCGVLNSMMDSTSLYETGGVLCCVDAIPDNCEDNNQTKHVNWNELQNAVDNSAEIPYSSFNMNFNPNTFEMTFDIDLEYIGLSSDGNFDLEYNLGTTYVVDFDSFGTSGNLINEPGNCQNRIYDSFESGTFDEWWGYSEYPYLTSNDLGSSTYLSYPPPSQYWTLSIDSLVCSPINYLGTFSWNELSECTDYNGNNLIDINDDGTSITLSGTLYVNLVSPYSMGTTDTGYYRSFPLIQQDFEIEILKQINILSSTGIDLFITSIIGIYEDQDDQSFELSVFTQTADYMQLINPQILLTPFGSPGAASISSVTTSCLTASTYTCAQIFTITINQTEINCPPADMSGIYSMSFDVDCRFGEDVCNTFIADNSGSTLVVLEVESNFVDNYCEPEMYSVIFDGSMTFYDDEEFLIEHNELSDNYVIGQDGIYVQVEVHFPDDGSGDNYNIFNVVIDNVFVCTADDQFNLTQNLNQQNGIGGCLSSDVDPDGEYIIIENGVEKEYNAQIIVYDLETNVVRFSFLTFDIGRTKMYVHAQLTLELINESGRRRMLTYRLLSSSSTSDQIRHFMDSITITNETIIISDKETEFVDDSIENNNSGGASYKLTRSTIKILFLLISSISVFITL